jgi:hypothetical protein
MHFASVPFHMMNTAGMREMSFVDALPSLQRSVDACPKQRFRSAFSLFCANLYGINLAHLLASL